MKSVRRSGFAPRGYCSESRWRWTACRRSRRTGNDIRRKRYPSAVTRSYRRREAGQGRPLRPHRLQGRAGDLRGAKAAPRAGRGKVSRDQSRLLQVDLCRLARRADRRIHPGPGRRRRDRCDPPRRRPQRTCALAIRRPSHQQRTARPRFLIGNF